MRWYTVSPIPVKRRVRFTLKGKAYKDTKTKEDLRRVAESYDGEFYKDRPLALVISVFQQLPESKSWMGIQPFTLKPDIDNVIKAVMDGLNGVAFVDDKQVVFVSCKKNNRTNEIQGEYVKYALCPIEELRNIGQDGQS